jgi:tetratricopeptide (TPR) repeat protein
VWNSLAPWGLSPLYEIPFRFSFSDLSFIFSASTVVAVTILCAALYRRFPALLAAWLTYIVIVLPVSGLFQSGPQLGADRYSYLACIGFAILAAGAMISFTTNSPNFRRRIPVAGAVTLATLITLAILTARQIAIWRDSLSLWNAVIARRPLTSLAYMNRAAVHAQTGNLFQAQTDLERSLELWPDEPTAMNNLASVLAQRGDYARSAALSRAVIHRHPGSVDAHVNLGYALLNLNEIEHAVEQYRAAFRLDANTAPMLAELATSLGQRGYTDLAITAARDLAESQPTNAQFQRLLRDLTAARSP